MDERESGETETLFICCIQPIKPSTTDDRQWVQVCCLIILLRRTPGWTWLESRRKLSRVLRSWLFSCAKSIFIMCTRVGCTENVLGVTRGLDLIKGFPVALLHVNKQVYSGVFSIDLSLKQTRRMTSSRRCGELTTGVTRLPYPPLLLIPL